MPNRLHAWDIFLVPESIFKHVHAARFDEPWTCPLYQTRVSSTPVHYTGFYSVCSCAEVSFLLSILSMYTPACLPCSRPTVTLLSYWLKWLITPISSYGDSSNVVNAFNSFTSTQPDKHTALAMSYYSLQRYSQCVIDVPNVLVM